MEILIAGSRADLLIYLVNWYGRPVIVLVLPLDGWQNDPVAKRQIFISDGDTIYSYQEDYYVGYLPNFPVGL